MLGSSGVVKPEQQIVQSSIVLPSFFSKKGLVGFEEYSRRRERSVRERVVVLFGGDILVWWCW